MSDQIVDQRFEALLRQSLEAEVTRLPMRVTADQVMDRAKFRRGARTGFLGRVQLNRFAFQVAAVAVMVVAAFGIGIWVSRPSVVGPSPLPSASPTASPPSVDLGIFEPVAGWIAYPVREAVQVSAVGIWAIDPVTLDRETKIQLTTGPGEPIAWSSDGTRLLILRPASSQLMLDEQLVVLHADGSETRLAPTPGGFNDATFSPDGSRVVFADAGALYSVDADGGPVELLVDLGDILMEGVTISPDGSQIAYVYGSGDNGHHVWVVDADGTDGLEIVANATTLGAGHVRGLAWSPAGDRIVLALGGFMYTFAPDGSDFTRVAGSDAGCESAPECAAKLQMYGTRPFWSPDGSQIVYTTGCIDGRTSCGLAIVNADGTNLRNSAWAFSGPWHPGSGPHP
jgi:hypothetical protein